MTPQDRRLAGNVVVSWVLVALGVSVGVYALLGVRASAEALPAAWVDFWRMFPSGAAQVARMFVAAACGGATLAWQMRAWIRSWWVPPPPVTPRAIDRDEANRLRRASSYRSASRR